MADEIKSEVPGEQKLRGVLESETTEEKEMTSFLSEPVLTVTTEETTFNNGGLQYQKITRSEDISDKNSSREIHKHRVVTKCEVLSAGQQHENGGEAEKSQDEKKTKTRIPMHNFRRIVRKVADEKTESILDEKETHSTHLKSSIPRLKDTKPSNIQRLDTVTPKTDEEFDKLFEEMIVNQKSADSPPLMKYPERLESKFEEIIHAYDDNVIKPINIDKKHTKIPLLKRKSEAEIKIPPQIERSCETSSVERSTKMSTTQVRDTMVYSKTTVEHNQRQTKVDPAVSNIHSNTIHFEESITTDHHKESKVESTFTFTMDSETFTNVTPIKNTEGIEGDKSGQLVKSGPGYTESFTLLSNKSDEYKPHFTEANITGITDEVRDNSPEVVEKPQNIKDDLVIEVNEEKVTNENEVKTVETEKVLVASPVFDKIVHHSDNKLENIKIQYIGTQQDSKDIVDSDKHNEKSPTERNTLDLIDTKRAQQSSTDSQVDSSTRSDKPSLQSASTVEVNPINEQHRSMDLVRHDTPTPIFIKHEDILTNPNASHQSSGLQNVNGTLNTIDQDVSSEYVATDNINKPEFTETNPKLDEIQSRIKNEFNIVKVQQITVEPTPTSEHNKASLKSYIKAIETKNANANVTENRVKRSTSLPWSKEETADLNSDLNDFKLKTPELKISSSTVDETKIEVSLDNKNTILNGDNNTLKCSKQLSDKNLIQSTIQKPVLDKSMTQELLNSDLQEEDILILRGKVNRVISRLDSRDPGQDVKKEIVDEVPKRTVLSKIAMFEKKDTTHEVKIKRSLSKIERDKPKIVNEILKPKSKNRIEVKQTNVEYRNTKLDHPTMSNLKHAEDTKVTKTAEKINKEQSVELTTKRQTDEVINEKNTSKRTNIHNEKQSDLSRLDRRDLIKSTKFITDVIDEEDVNSELQENILKDNIEGLKVAKTKRRDMRRGVSYSATEVSKKMDFRRGLSCTELGDSRGKVRELVVKMVSLERMDLEKKGIIDVKEKPLRGSVLEKIAMFEKKSTPIKIEIETPKVQKSEDDGRISEEDLMKKIAELAGARRRFGRRAEVKVIELSDGGKMPALGLGTALLSKDLTKHIVSAAIDLGYRTIDTAYIYGNEKEIGEAISEKIKDGTVKREELFIISKLWSTFHRRDLVEKACRMSLKTMGLDYFDLYMIHNPMSLKEGEDPVPKIANVLQYSESDYLDAWFGVESAIKKGLARRGGVSNFNSAQLDRVIDKGRIKPVVNQVECHPYLTQQRLKDFSESRSVKLSCYGILGSKGTPLEWKSGQPPVIDDPLLLVMAAGLNITPAQLLISYQLHQDHSVIVKSSSGAHLWSNLQALDVQLNSSHMTALHALNRNKRNFTFKGMGDTHRNYPFRIPF